MANQLIQGSGGGGCFAAGTLVATPSGQRRIEELKVGDEVIAFTDGGELVTETVEACHYHADEPIWAYRFWNGLELFATPNHWVLNQYGTFAEVGTLTEQDAVIDGNGHIRPLISSSFELQGEVYNLTVTGAHTYIANNVRVHNTGRGEGKLAEVIRGSGGGGGKGGGGGRAPVEAPDSLRSRAYARVLDLVCEGEVEGLSSGLQSIYLNETPLQNPDGSLNFSGLYVESRNGSQGQGYLAGFPAVENELIVGLQVKQPTPLVRTITSPDIDAVRVRVSVPQLSSTNTSNGDISGTDVQLAIDVQSNGGGYVPQILSAGWRSDAVFAVSGLQIRSNQNVYRLQIGVNEVGSIFGVDFSYVVEYKRVSEPSSAWRSDGVTQSSNSASGKSIFGAVVALMLGQKVYTTPSLNFDVWEMRVRVTSGSAPVIVASSGDAGLPYDTISGKTSTKYERSYLIPLQGTPPFDIRVRRITADSTSATLSNATFWESYTEIIDSKLRYPNSALVGIRLDAAQFQGIPTRAYDMKLLRVKVPSNYDPVARTYSGVWSGAFKIAWTDNPAWVLYDLLTNSRYGLGEFVAEAQVDKWGLYTIARYCDELVPNGFGGFEPRFTCNAYIQSQNEAYRVVQDIASVFRGMVFWSSGSIAVTQDAPSDPVYLYTPANVVGGDFQYSGSSRRARHTVALVTWNDPEDFYRQKVEYVEDNEGIARYGVIETQITAFGCTSRGQANRVGRWLLYSERSESETVTFKTGLDGAVVRPGQIVKVADPVRGGARLGGRIASASSLSITLDSDLGRSVVGWTLSVVTPSGGVETKTVSSQSGLTLVISGSFDAVPQVGGIWVLSSSEVEAQLFRVITVTEEADGTFQVTGLAHNPDKYNAIEQGLTLQPRDITLLSSTPAPVTGLTVSESLYRYKDEARVLVSVAWQASQTAIEYRVFYRYNGGNRIELEKTGSPYAEIQNAQPGAYEFFVRAVSTIGKESQEVSVNATILGKLAPPANVTGFTIERRTTDLLLSWTANDDADLAGYEVRFGSSWDNSTLLGRVSGTQLVHDQSQAGLYYYHIRAFDTSGVYSANVTTYALELIAPASVRQFDVVQSANRLEFRWLPNAEPEVVAYEVREGSAWDTSLFIAETKSTSLTIPAGFQGTRTFWIKAIASPGIYSNTAVFVTNAVAQPQNANLIISQDEQATGFNGIRHFMVDANVSGTDVLKMAPDATRSEYLFDVDLGQSYRAQNTLLTSIGAVRDDRETWATANYAWNSPDANRQWTYNGSIQNVSARFQISREDVLQEGEVYGWRLNNSLAEFNANATVIESDSVSYAEGRYGNGAVVSDITSIGWSLDISLPTTFSKTFWYIPDEVTTCVIATLSGSTYRLAVGYDAETGEFFLEDELYRTLRVPFAIDADDRVLIGICQTATERRLFIGKMGGASIGKASAAYATPGAFSTFRLH